MNNRVLIITYYWPPSGGAGVQRWLKFTKYLPEFGIQPYVLTVANPTYPFTDESLNGEVPDQVPVYKARSLEPFALYGRLTGKSAGEVGSPVADLRGKRAGIMTHLGSWVRANLFIPDARVGWVPAARRKALSLVRSEELGAVVTTGPPHSVHSIGAYLQRKTGLRWIGDFRDPWVDIHYNHYLPRTGLARRVDRKLERRTLSRVDEAVVVSGTMKQQFREIVERNYHVITNGFDPDDFEPDEQPMEEEFTIRYVGKLGETVIPYGLMRALSQVTVSRAFRVEFIGHVHGRLRELITEWRLEDRVHLRPYMPMKEANRQLQRSHLQLLVLPDTPGNELILSGKLFNYIGAGRPILLIGPCHGDAARIVEEHGLGVCFEHADAEGIRAWLEDALRNGIRPGGDATAKSGSTGTSGTAGRAAGSLHSLHRFSRRELAARMAEVVKGD